MTLSDLRKGNELAEKMRELNDNIMLLEYALSHSGSNGKIKRFFLSCFRKNKIDIGGDCISFNGRLSVDRECMELLQDYFKKKLEKASSEFDNIGKVGAE